MNILVRIDQRKDGEIIPVFRHISRERARELIATLYDDQPENIYTISYEKRSLDITVGESQ